jgi:hypothetical protein
MSNIRIYNDEIYNNYNKKLNEIYKYISDLSIIAINNVDNENKIEGNYFSFNIDSKIDTSNTYKQSTLYHCALNADLNICEIGFNTGFTSLLILLSRKNIKSTNLLIFDIGEHNYVKPCLEYIKNNFENNETKINYIEGNSIITLPEYIKTNPSSIGNFDLIHIDGGHSVECIINDMRNADKLIKNNGIIIIDDTDDDMINHIIELYILSQKYIEIFLLDLSKCISPHRIIKKIK